ncbi:MAG: hypothetical protein AUH81_17240 [Candidatus Rokubacteria bacterium 13_1_40CM_4_69_5]|nr:MAG: hypothetical protein AUH81_17240 [Candidatus Rokubacteria bacterium 13_1_40CM_4_69_5]
MTAQSPSAHTPGQPWTSMYSLAATRPRSFWHGSVARSGWEAVPAVHTSVLAGITVPSLSLTPASDTPAILVFTRISTLRPVSFV